MATQQCRSGESNTMRTVVTDAGNGMPKPPPPGVEEGVRTGVVPGVALGVVPGVVPGLVVGVEAGVSPGVNPAVAAAVGDRVRVDVGLALTPEPDELPPPQPRTTKTGNKTASRMRSKRGLSFNGDPA